MHISPDDLSRLNSFLPLAHTIIIYRTALSQERISQCRRYNARVIFEVDDLIVGRSPLVASGILTQVSESQAIQLLAQAEAFHETAAASDALIVSTRYLADLYSAPILNLSHKPIIVVPNYVETPAFRSYDNKSFTFAFTSPSSSIKNELSTLIAFLRSYDEISDRSWSILIVGNSGVTQALSAAGVFKFGEVVSEPFLTYDEYLIQLAKAKMVLIPLTDNDFNRAKTPIRLMDAAVAGTQALFCPVGDYTTILDAMADKTLCVAPSQWEGIAPQVMPYLSDRAAASTADLQQAVRQVYGIESAIACYKAVFFERLGLEGVVQRQLISATDGDTE